MSRSRLSPRLRDRIAAAVPGPGWRRVALLRKLAAGVLATAALVLAIIPPDRAGGVPVVVAVADLGAGAPVRAADLGVRIWPAALAPTGALSEVAAVEGRVLVGAARAGEALTDVRLAAAGSALRDRPDAAAVPVRLADPGVASLLTPGSRVDVVTTGNSLGEPIVLAADAAVLVVLPDEGGGPGAARGRLVLVTMPRQLAARVAAASIADQVAITLR